MAVLFCSDGFTMNDKERARGFLHAVWVISVEVPRSVSSARERQVVRERVSIR